MFPNGFLGTRADLLMDIILLAVIAVPFVLLFSFRKVRAKDYKTHSLIQWLIFIVVFTAVILFETNIQMSGGSGSLIAGGELTKSTGFKILLPAHITIAVLTYATWFFLLLVSSKKFKRAALPGSFSVNHKKFGVALFIGACLTALTGLAVYVISFVL